MEVLGSALMTVMDIWGRTRQFGCGAGSCFCSFKVSGFLVFFCARWSGAVGCFRVSRRVCLVWWQAFVGRVF